MRVSKNFLNDYIKVDDLDFKEVANKMVFAGNEYESVSKISEATGIVVGHVLECEMHPESKKLHICKVDLGDEVVQILCGAPNMRQGIKVPVAKIGAKLPNGIEIKKAKLAGMDSFGMCCALEELGIETMPSLASNFLYYMKQNGVFDKIKGLWIGFYEHESGIPLEKVILDTLENKYNFPIIKSNNFGHTETKTVIPIGIKARIDTTKDKKIELIENCVK